jgi:hypothetical protein
MPITGYFASPDEMNKLVQSKLLPGVVQQVYEVGQLLPRLPVTTVDAYTLKWNREGTQPSISEKSKGEQYGWKEVATYSQVTLGLKEYGDQWALVKGAQETYKDPNDYRGVIQAQIIKGALRTIEDQLIYGNATTYPKQFDGLDKLCAATGGHNAWATYQDWDMGGGTIGLSISALLGLMRACKPRPSFILMPGTIQDKLFIYSMGKAGAIVMARQADEFGKMISYINGVPIVVSDYLTTETDNTGGKASTALVSIYAIRTGSIEDGGVSLVVGGSTGGKDFFEVDHFEKLEDYNAEGIRAYCYVALAMGSTSSVSRIHSICQTTAIDATS